MQTRRGFFGAAMAAIAAVSSVASGAVISRSRTYVKMRYLPGVVPGLTPSVFLTPDTPTEFVISCSAPTRRELVKFVHALRDSVWSPKLRRVASARSVATYMESYDYMLTCMTPCAVTGGYQLLYYTNYLTTCTEDLPTKLMKYDVVLHDECSNKIMRRFKSSTKHGHTRTLEVIRTAG